jgi:hypothetical protein
MQDICKNVCLIQSRELPVALSAEPSDSMGLMNLQLPWSPACLPYVLPDTHSYRTIPVRRQNRAAVAPQ